MREGSLVGNQVHVSAAKLMLEQRGWDVTVVTPFSGRAVLRTPLFGARYLFKLFSSALDVWWLRFGHQIYLRKALRRALAADSRPALIYAQDPLSAQAALELRRPGIDTVVLIVHFNDSQAQEWVQRAKISPGGALYRRIAHLEEVVLPRVDRVIFVSEYMRNRLLSRLPALTKEKSEIIPNFIETPVPSETSTRRDLIAIGTLEPRKNQEYILQVIAHLKSQGVQVSATIVGDGEDRTKLTALALTLGIDQQVFFAGNVPNAGGLLSSHTLQVHAARLENCPIALVEGLASGLPLVAAKVGGIPEIFDETSGRFWDLSSVSDGAQCVSSLLSNPALLASMRSASRRRFDEKFSPMVAGEQMDRLFRSLYKSSK
jgi:glycosyltransferase involved in cell wall biosynthesis